MSDTNIKERLLNLFTEDNELFEKYKSRIVGLIEYGAYTDPEVPFSHLLCFFPFLEYIAEADDLGGAYVNENWFWASSNNGNRVKLVDTIKKIKSFTEGDLEYAKILSRATGGVCGVGHYGIMTPLPADPSLKGHVSYSVLADLAKHFDMFPDYEKYVSEEYYRKLIYCKENEHSFDEFLIWVEVEKLLHFHVNFKAAMAAYSALYGSCEELKDVYMTNIYYALVDRMRDFVTNHKTLEVPLLASELVKKYKNASTSDSNKYLKELEELFYPPECASETEKQELQDQLDSYLIKTVPF